MCKKELFKAIPILLFLLSFSGCGDIDYLSSAQNYKVNGLVDGISLDDCSVIGSASEIEPYFDSNIEGDTDTAELVVLIKNNRGKVQSNVFRYILPKSKNRAAEGSEAGTNTLTAGTGGTNSEKAGSAAGTAEKTKSDAGTAGTKAVSQDTNEKSIDTEEPQNGEDTEKPDSTENDEDTVKKTEEETKITETQINIDSLGDKIPVFSFPEDLPMGFYTVVFQVIGYSGEVLSSTEKPVFYLADKKFTIEDIRSYIPGGSAAAQVVPPSAKIMLETKMSADSDFDPYIVWYQGKNKICAGSVSQGFDRILWTAPKQTGFQTIKAEVFPFDPVENGFIIKGLSRDIALPVSTRHGRLGYFSAIADSFSRWYEFWGNLYDSADPSDKERSLVIKKEGAEARWLPASYSYGLAVGNKDQYSLPQPFFGKIRAGEGSGLLLIRFVPVDGGKVFYAELSKEESALPIKLNLSYLNGEVVLSVEDTGEIFTLQRTVDVLEDGFITVAADFQFFEETIIISLAVEAQEGDFVYGNYGEWESMELEAAFGGRSSLYFGSDTKEDGYTAVITELGVSYPGISPAFIVDEDGVPEKPVDTDDIDDSKIAGENSVQPAS
ncbi:hypothetical protein AGMMS50212_06420 [Spirochaetia bacterium]|nr:hypothetical protein AGMMS50212_06330 [Spirochaetia bacterium]GHV83302.1 hypothetical protein AGMMS50212_06420 [Spirochaetia bacterium]